jgi:hypothetical protein
VKLASVMIFAAGYVIGARAGGERYAQIVKVAERTSQRLNELSSRRSPDVDDVASGHGEGDSRSQKSPL